MASVDVEESRVKRLEKQQSRYRDRGGIFVPAETNPLLETLLARGPNGESPSKPSQKRRARSQTRSPVRQSVPASESRTTDAHSVQRSGKGRRRGSTAKPVASAQRTGRKSTTTRSDRSTERVSKSGPSGSQLPEDTDSITVQQKVPKTARARAVQSKTTRKAAPKRQGNSRDDDVSDQHDPTERIAPSDEKALPKGKAKRPRRANDEGDPGLDDSAPLPKRARTKEATATKAAGSRKNGKPGTSEVIPDEHDIVPGNRSTNVNATEERRKRAKRVIDDEDVVPATQQVPAHSESKMDTHSQLPADSLAAATVAESSTAKKRATKDILPPKGKSRKPAVRRVLLSDDDEPAESNRKAGPSTTQRKAKGGSGTAQGRSSQKRTQKNGPTLDDQESSDSDTPLALVIVGKQQPTTLPTNDKNLQPRPTSKISDPAEGQPKPSKQVRQNRKNATEEHGQSEPNGRGRKKRSEATASTPHEKDDEIQDEEQDLLQPKKNSKKETSSRSKDRTKVEKKPSHKENRNAQKPASKGRAPMPKPRLSMFPIPNVIPDDDDSDDPLDCIG
ncbi:hypothetical protein QCA50_008066 [Cerrena zonata]|uniref:Uncharacterized protein n=1 Tax=Cerrena zonata TaxID=2478898 RepID=A0AAW0G5I5_9APHY